MRFTKMNGAGNDFIILDTIRQKIPPEQLPRMAKVLCDRRRSIGADGLMAVAPSEKADCRMLFFNSDGSMGEMCGNGARCICRFACENGYAGQTQTIETTAGIVTGVRISKREYRIRLNTPSTVRLDEKLTVDGKICSVSYVELGDPGIPHAIVELPGWSGMSKEDLQRLGKAIRSYADFPKGTNVTFAELIGENRVNAVTFERGVEAFTLACGTGAGSTAAILTVRGLVTGKNVKIKMPGGELIIDLDRDGQTARNIFLTGPAVPVCTGEIRDE